MPMTRNKTVFLIVPGLNGRRLPLIHHLAETLQTNGKVVVMEHDHLGSVKDRADELQKQIDAQWHQGATQIALIGHSLGGYIAKQLDWTAWKNRKMAFIGISTPPDAARIRANVERGRSYLMDLLPDDTAHEAFDPHVLFQEYDFNRRTPPVPYRYIWTGKDKLAMPAALERKKKSDRSGKRFIRVSTPNATNERTVFDRHNWQDPQARAQLMAHITEFLMDAGFIPGDERQRATVHHAR